MSNFASHLRSTYKDLANFVIFSQLPVPCFGPGFARPSKPIVREAATASRYEYGYLTLPAPTVPLPMTITMAPGASELYSRGITKPGM